MAATHLNPPDAPRAQCLGIPVFGDILRQSPETGKRLGANEGELSRPQIFWDIGTAQGQRKKPL